MDLFFTTLDRMAFLIALIAIGFILVKCKVVSMGASGILSRLENNVFLPALVMGTFLKNFTLERLASTWTLFVAGFVVVGISIPIAILCARLCAKEAYLRRIYTYGLAISNFSFMGNAVVSALFPDIFTEYLIFTLPFWIMIQLWAVPVLLIPDDSEKRSIGKSLKALANPMLIAMVIGMVLGLLELPLPSFATSLVSDTGACMSPIAMLLTGITVAGIDLRATLKKRPIYFATFLRLIVFPLVGVGVLVLLPLPETLEMCVMCTLAMPLGLNTVVIPGAYGRDTTDAAGMALISHVLSGVTIPLIFMLVQYIL